MKFPELLIVSLVINQTSALNCYECTSELFWGEYDPCYYGDVILLKPTLCVEPSVCATYLYYRQTLVGYRMTVSRGCQAVRYGATCDEIFEQLQRNGLILPGQHTCATCNQDYCNDAMNHQMSLFLFLLITLIYLL